MVEATKQKNKLFVSSINKIHTTSLEIEEWCTQTQKKLQKEQIDYFKSRESEYTNYFKSKDVEINNI